MNADWLILMYVGIAVWGPVQPLANVSEFLTAMRGQRSDNLGLNGSMRLSLQNSGAQRGRSFSHLGSMSRVHLE